MAEFKISRIRYTWKGNWATSTNYNRDDVVKYGGSSWVCIRQHTSGSFASDQTFLANPSDTAASPAWIKMTDGREFKGSWAGSTVYAAGDVVIYSGNLYLSVANHTSGLIFDNDIANWTVYAEGSNYRQSWATSTRYGVGDIVRYGGIVYKCIEGHSSSNITNGLEADQNKWEILYEGIQFVGNWEVGQRYKINDLVKYGGTIFRCKEGHTSGTDSTINFDFDEHWELEFPGFQRSGEWNSTTVYQLGDIVRHGGQLYYSLTVNYGSNPTSSIYQVEDRQDPIDWQVISKGINFRGDWSSSAQYKSGDVVRRGGNLYVNLLDTVLTADGSTDDYLDTSNWELVVPGQRWMGPWTAGTNYGINDLVIFLGDTFICTEPHLAENDNYPGDNGSGFDYWDLIIQAGAPAGLTQTGDLLTYDLSRKNLVGDLSTFGITSVPIGTDGQVVTINNENSVIYKDFGQVSRSVYVAPEGVDDEDDPQRGYSPFKPWKTVKFACERVDDGFTGFTTVNVLTGRYEEVTPIIVPARTVVLGDELRSTAIVANPANPNLTNDSFYTRAALARISQLIQSLISGTTLNPPKTLGNNLNPVVLTEFVTVQISALETAIVEQPIATDPQAALDIQDLISDMRNYISFFVDSTGSNPTQIGTNTAVTSTGYTNAVLVLEANKEFLQEEIVAFMNLNYGGYDFDEEFYRHNVKRWVNAWKFDIIYTGNFKSLYEARYYRNAVLGSNTDDMFYVRDATGIRNCTLQGLTGTLNPPNVFNLYRLPTGGAYVSLDPGWGPADNRTWITTRSPYIQGVTTIGSGCIGQKIDGSLHNGGNKSIVSNDFTQVLSDGIGAWVLNNGRVELVSVFTYYCHVGYLAEDGGIIRATNGNCSYGNFGAIADGIDPTEVPQTATVYNRNQEAIVRQVLAGNANDEILILEWTNAGQEYTQASASFVSSGINASIIFEDFRDDAVHEVRRLDTSNNEVSQAIGGSGYTVVQGNAQVHSTPGGDTISITIASNDPNFEEDYVGMRLIITGGTGTGQYGYITSYDIISKVVTISKESTGEPGWDHIIPGTAISVPLDTTTSYRIEPRVLFDHPGFTATQHNAGVTTDWSEIVYGEITQSFNNVVGDPGTGTVITQDGLTPLTARFNVLQEGRIYTVTLANPGAGYSVGDTITIEGTSVGGVSPDNDIVITVIETTDDSTNAIVDFEYEGAGHAGKFVAVTLDGTAGIYSNNGENWTSFTLPSNGDWTCLGSGNNRFVAIRKNSDAAASSLNGITWTARTMPSSSAWNSVAYGGGKFVAIAGDNNAAAVSADGITWSAATMPTIGDSTNNEWIDITYGKGKFVAIANSGNIAAYSSDGETWNGALMDVISDSSQKDWVSVAYGNNRYVALTSTGEIAYSFDGEIWFSGGTMPTQDGSTAHYWKKIRYGQGVFFAVGDTGGRNVGGDFTTGLTNFAATSEDGIQWSSRTMATSSLWKSIAFGNPYINNRDSTVGKNTPMWVALASNSSFVNKIRTGKRAQGRVGVNAGIVSEVRLLDPGSAYLEPPSMILVDPNNTGDISVECRLADGVLSDPSWLNRGIGYRTNNTRVTITGNGFADVIPTGKFITVKGLERYPGAGGQILFDGNSTRYNIVIVTPLGNLGNSTDGLYATFRISPELRARDKVEDGLGLSIIERYSQCRITGHDFLDVGTGNFEQTNYPELYSTGIYVPAPENEVVEEDGGRVFYTSTDQSGNFRTGELFAVEQATGIVTISADFFDFSGLTELRLGGIRIGGSGVVIREFSTDPLFTEDSNNIVSTQRAIAAYLNNRLTVGGSELATASFIAGLVRVGPDFIGNTLGNKVVIPVRADFTGPDNIVGIRGSILAQTMFYKSFNSD